MKAIRYSIRVACNFAIANVCAALPLLWAVLGWMPDQVRIQMKGGQPPALVVGGTVQQGEKYGAWQDGTVWRFYMREGMAWENLEFRLPEGMGAEDVGRVALQKWKLVVLEKEGKGLERVAGSENGFRFTEPAGGRVGMASGCVEWGLWGAEMVLLAASWLAARKRREYRWGRLWAGAGWVGFGVAFWLWVAVPVQSWVGNESAFPFSEGELACWTGMRFALGWAGWAAGLWLLSGCFGEWVLGGGLSFGICVWLETGVLSAGLPELNGDWRPYWDFSRGVWDAAVWAGVFAGILGAHRWLKGKYGWAGVVLAAMAGAALADMEQEAKPDAGQFVVDDFCSIGEVVRSVVWSPKKNVLVLVVDSLEREQAHAIMEDAEAGPGLREQFRGFTEYVDNVGALWNSWSGVANLMTGRTPKSLAGLPDFHASIYAEASVLADYLREGYDIYMGTEALGYGWTNRRKGGGDSANKGDVFRRRMAGELGWNLAELIRFRCWPFVGKKVVASLTGMGVPGHANWGREEILYGVLRTHGVGGRDTGVFALFHTRGVHPPVERSRDGERLARPDPSNRGCIEAGIWALRQVGGFMDALKEKGIWDGATILVLADHGNHDHRGDGAEAGVPGNGRPFLWVKMAGSTHDFAADATPTYHGKVANLLRILALRDVGESEIGDLLAAEVREYRVKTDWGAGMRVWRVGRDGEVEVGEEEFQTAGRVQALEIGRTYALGSVPEGTGIVFTGVGFMPGPILLPDQEGLFLEITVPDPDKAYCLKLAMKMRKHPGFVVEDEAGASLSFRQEGVEGREYHVEADYRTEAVLRGLRSDREGKVRISGSRRGGLRSDVFFLTLKLDEDAG